MPSEAKNRTLFELPDVPVLQNLLYESAHDAIKCSTGQIKLVESQRTGLIFNERFDAAIMGYENEYLSSPEISQSFQIHLEHTATIVQKYLGNEGLVEIGSGQGYFLELLAHRGASIVGYDPSYAGTNPSIKKSYFTDVEPSTTAGNFILRHVLEHIENPMQFLQKLGESSKDALVYIEVPCFDWICTNRSWVDIFYEHVNYFRLSDFSRIFREVIDCGHVFGGQYFYIVANLSSLNAQVQEPQTPIDFPSDFMTLNFAQSPAVPISVWGAGAKGVMFALHAIRAGYTINHAIDINPAKQGKFIPATGIEVISAEQAMRDLPNGYPIYVMNNNYLEEIKKMTLNKFQYLKA